MSGLFVSASRCICSGTSEPSTPPRHPYVRSYHSKDSNALLVNERLRAETDRHATVSDHLAVVERHKSFLRLSCVRPYTFPRLYEAMGSTRTCLQLLRVIGPILFCYAQDQRERFRADKSARPGPVEWSTCSRVVRIQDCITETAAWLELDRQCKGMKYLLRYLPFYQMAVLFFPIKFHLSNP